MRMKVLGPERPNQTKTDRRRLWISDCCALFVAVAEELHLARAAERLGIEQSAVSRAMRDLENQLAYSCSTQHTSDAADLGRPSVPRRMPARAATVEQAIKSAKAAAQGYQGGLRIAICDSWRSPHCHLAGTQPRG